MVFTGMGKGVQVPTNKNKVVYSSQISQWFSNQGVRLDLDNPRKIFKDVFKHNKKSKGVVFWGITDGEYTYVYPVKGEGFKMNYNMLLDILRNNLSNDEYTRVQQGALTSSLDSMVIARQKSSPSNELHRVDIQTILDALISTSKKMGISQFTLVQYLQIMKESWPAILDVSGSELETSSPAKLYSRFNY